MLLVPDRTEIERCWDLLPHMKGSVTRMFARNRETQALDGDFARSASEMYHFAEINADKQTYVCPNPATGTTGTRHTAEQTSHWSYLLIDMDPIEDEFDPEPAMEEALLWLGEWNGRDFGPRGQRPLIIDSGRGRQAWIRLEDHQLAPDGQVIVMEMLTPVQRLGTQDPTYLSWTCGWDRRTTRKVCGYWLGKLADKLGMCHGCKVDTSTSDLPRPMRMPGTFNQKTRRMARIVEPGSGVFGGLGSILVSQVPKDKLVEPPPPRVIPGRRWQQVSNALTKTAKDYLKGGQEEPGRHKVMWHTAKKLHELGVERDECRRALTQANRKRGRSQELSAEEIEHALDTAYGD